MIVSQLFLSEVSNDSANASRVRVLKSRYLKSDSVPGNGDVRVNHFRAEAESSLDCPRARADIHAEQVVQ